jgi:hypothetical protein
VNDPYERTLEFALIQRIARALREELGSDKEDQPALHDPDQAGQINRAFRIVTRTILSTIVPPVEDLARVLTWTLNRLVRRRLADAGLNETQAALVLGMEPASRDDWTAFLILTTTDELQQILREQGPNSE